MESLEFADLQSTWALQEGLTAICGVVNGSPTILSHLTLPRFRVSLALPETVRFVRDSAGKVNRQVSP